MKEATRARVAEEAERMGYRVNPIASELMARMRRSHADAFRGVIAVVAVEGDADLEPAPRRRRAILRRSAEQCATELGFKLDPVVVGSEAGWTRLLGVLRARGVIGVLLLPSARCRVEHRALLGGAEFPTVYADAPEEGAEHVDAVAPDYRQALTLARSRLAALGCVRPGLVLSRKADAAANLHWQAAQDALRAPMIVVDAQNLGTGAVVERWRREHGVDALMVEQEVSGIGAGGLPVCLLDRMDENGVAPGLDLRWADIASRAVDVLARQYFDRLRGRRETPAMVSLPALWRGAGTCAPRETIGCVVAEFPRRATSVPLAIAGG